jgi:hypothetical protein
MGRRHVFPSFKLLVCLLGRPFAFWYFSSVVGRRPKASAPTGSRRLRRGATLVYGPPVRPSASPFSHSSQPSRSFTCLNSRPSGSCAAGGPFASTESCSLSSRMLLATAATGQRALPVRAPGIATLPAGKATTSPSSSSSPVRDAPRACLSTSNDVVSQRERSPLSGELAC